MRKGHDLLKKKEEKLNELESSLREEVKCCGHPAFPLPFLFLGQLDLKSPGPGDGLRVSPLSLLSTPFGLDA